VLTEHKLHLDGALDRVESILTQTHSTVLDVKGTQQVHGQQLDQIYQAILDLKRQHEEQASVVKTTPTEAAEAIRPWWKTVPEFGEEFATWHIFDPQSEEVLCDAVSADGRRALTGHADTTVHLWDLATGKERVCLLGHLDKVYSVAFVGGAQALSSGSDKTVRLWDLAKGRELQVFEGKTNRGMAVSADGRLVLTGSTTDGMIRLWELKTGRELRRFKGHMSWVLALLFLDGDRRAVSCSADRTVRLWEVATGRELKRFTGHSEQVFSVAVSPDGRQIASASLDGTVRVWDAMRGTELRRNALRFER
jgi:WD40 repeat protein